MLDEYWKRRNAAAIKLEEKESLEGLGPANRIEDNLHPLDARIARSFDGLTGAFSDLKNKLVEWREEKKD